MNNGRAIVRLGEVLTHRKESIRIDDTQLYRRCRVQMHGKGVVLRDVVVGSEIKTKQQQVCHAGDFLVAEIDAKVGGFGIVPPELHGALVSSHYFLFRLDQNRLERRFLNYYIRTPAFQDQVVAQGTTNYAAIRPQHVLDYVIPLPPLTEQQRIVARLDTLAAGIAETRRLRVAALEEAHLLLRAILFSSDNWTAELTPMSKLVSLRNSDIKVSPDGTYQFAGVYSFGRGVFIGGVKPGTAFKYSRLTRLNHNDFVYPKLMAWEGALGIVPAECDGMVVSPEFPVFEVNQDRVLPEVLDVYFKTPAVWSSIASLSTGTNIRRRRLHPRAFLTFMFPLPPKEIQMQLRDVKHRFEKLSNAHGEFLADLNLLLPSVLDRTFRGEL